MIIYKHNTYTKINENFTNKTYNTKYDPEALYNQ